MLTQYIFWSLNLGVEGYWDGGEGWERDFYNAHAMTADQASAAFDQALLSNPDGFILVTIVSPI